MGDPQNVQAIYHGLGLALFIPPNAARKSGVNRLIGFVHCEPSVPPEPATPPMPPEPADPPEPVVPPDPAVPPEPALPPTPPVPEDPPEPAAPPESLDPPQGEEQIPLRQTKPVGQSEFVVQLPLEPPEPAAPQEPAVKSLMPGPGLIGTWGIPAPAQAMPAANSIAIDVGKTDFLFIIPSLLLLKS